MRQRWWRLGKPSASSFTAGTHTSVLVREPKGDAEVEM